MSNSDMVLAINSHIDLRGTFMNPYRFRKHLGLILLVSILLTGQLLAQVSVSTNLDTAAILIGDHLKLSVNIAAPPGTSIQEIAYGKWEEDSAVELLDMGQLNTVAEQPQLIQHQELLLTSFDSGYHVLAPLAVIYEHNGQRDTAYSDDLGLTVMTIPVQVDTDIRDNKDIIEEPYNWRDAMPYAIGALVALLIIGLIWWLAGRQPKIEVAPPPPPIPAHETALEKLDTLAAAALWEKGEIKTFQYELTYVLREYLDDRYTLSTLEATTPETMDQLRGTTLTEEQQTSLKAILDQADMVKFAKAIPPIDVHPRALEVVRTLVEQTKVLPVIQTETEAPDENTEA